MHHSELGTRNSELGPSARRVIVNADDLGLSPGVNRGVIAAHEHGIVTSASLMVRWPAAIEAAAYAREHPRLTLGLHVDLGEWVYRDETWVPRYEVVPLGEIVAVTHEVLRQLAAFRRLVGRAPSHIDSHQHVHRSEPVRSVMEQVAREIAAPLRGCHPDIRYCGDFYGQTGRGEPYPDAISADGLIAILAALPSGLTELGCHPGFGEDLASTYRTERAREVEVLRDRRVRAATIELGITLCSFNDISIPAG